SAVAQEQADAVRKEWERTLQEWDAGAKRIRMEYVRDNPPPLVRPRESGAEAVGVSKRKTNVSNCVVLDHA
ncbi:hypothetical protein LTR02_018364, partial [Friedmanniomyces endolithicus]